MSGVEERQVAKKLSMNHYYVGGVRRLYLKSVTLFVDIAYMANLRTEKEVWNANIHLLSSDGENAAH